MVEGVGATHKPGAGERSMRAAWIAQAWDRKDPPGGSVLSARECPLMWSADRLEAMSDAMSVGRLTERNG